MIAASEPSARTLAAEWRRAPGSIGTAAALNEPPVTPSVRRKAYATLTHRVRGTAGMKAAVLHDFGATPRCEEFEDPTPVEGAVVVEVEAAAVNHLDLDKASGDFYGGASSLPSVTGSDGVGRLADGRRVYFDATIAPYGSMAQRALVAEAALVDVADAADSAVAAALGNSGLAAWLSLEWRARLKPGETVLVLAATGAVGATAVQVAAALGAGRVVAAARADERLGRLTDRGADSVVDLDDDDLARAFREAANGRVDIIIDPLWGPPAVAAMTAAADGARHVQIGNLAATTLDLPATRVRSSALNIMGFAVFHAPIEVRRDA
jgi:NADPH:quinone reductase-like Zn-dependent oxidoreductase